MADITQTDVSRPSALPSARLRPAASQSQSIVDQSSDEYLDFVEEEWNKKIDTDVEVLVECMSDLVSIASVSLASLLCVATLKCGARLGTRTSIE